MRTSLRSCFPHSVPGWFSDPPGRPGQFEWSWRLLRPRTRGGKAAGTIHSGPIGPRSLLWLKIAFRRDSGRQAGGSTSSGGPGGRSDVSHRLHPTSPNEESAQTSPVHSDLPPRRVAENRPFWHPGDGSAPRRRPCGPIELLSTVRPHSHAWGETARALEGYPIGPAALATWARKTPQNRRFRPMRGRRP